jgi:hypothetical protein
MGRPFSASAVSYFSKQAVGRGEEEVKNQLIFLWNRKK